MKKRKTKKTPTHQPVKAKKKPKRQGEAASRKRSSKAKREKLSKTQSAAVSPPDSGSSLKELKTKIRGKIADGTTLLDGDALANRTLQLKIAQLEAQVKANAGSDDQKGGKSRAKSAAENRGIQEEIERIKAQMKQTN